jgi:hypothetical protein
MKIHNIPKAVGIFAIGIIIVSTIQWMFLYPDYSQFILGVGLGLGVLYCCYDYNYHKNLDEKMEYNNKRVDNLSKFYYKEELE